MITYSIAEDENCFENVKKDELANKYHFFYPCNSTSFCKPYNVTLQRGIYKFELWGAQGGDGRKPNNKTLNKGTAGRGSYSSGVINIHISGTELFLYIGGRGEDQIGTEQGAFGKGGYNGGGDGGIDKYDPKYPESAAGGGGATDIRLVYNEEFNDTSSLKSRIIVAAGGGGAVSSDKIDCEYSEEGIDGDFLCENWENGIWSDYRGGPGGTLNGYRLNSAVYTGNQTSGSFGVGTNGLSMGIYYVNNETIWGGSTGGGGGGYFGGTSITENPNIPWLYGGGAGGSSYVSGCNSCRSVNISCDDEVVTTENTVHYSGLRFYRIQMMSGIENFTSPDGNQEKGHAGNGHITITYLRAIENTSNYLFSSISFYRLITSTLAISLTSTKYH